MRIGIITGKTDEISLDKEKRTKMGKNSRQIVESEYDVKIVNDKTIKLYNL